MADNIKVGTSPTPPTRLEVQILIRIVVRVRPLNAREIARGANVIVKMDGNQTILSPPEGAGTTRTPDKPRVFSYDHSYWSFDKKDAHYGTLHARHTHSSDSTTCL
jgi:hypothetical protein